jgi:FMN reductase
MNEHHIEHSPRILGIGGTTRPGSSTERALRYAATEVARLGGRMKVFCGSELILPPYCADKSARSVEASRLVNSLRNCDAMLVASPGYHGSVSGLVKNALEYSEDLAHDDRPFFEGRAIGCIVGGLGWQAIGTTLVSLRSVVHSLRAWSAPTEVAMNTAGKVFGTAGEVLVPEIKQDLDALVRQIVEFARMRHAYEQRHSKVSESPRDLCSTVVA